MCMYMYLKYACTCMCCTIPCTGVHMFINNFKQVPWCTRVHVHACEPLNLNNSICVHHVPSYMHSPSPLLLPPGAGMFVTSVVVGSVAIVKPFTLTQSPFLRDVLFYLIGVFWTFVILWQNKVTIYSAIGEYTMLDVYVPGF